MSLMTTLSEYYLSQFSAEGTYGLGAIFPGWLAVLILFWMLTLSILVWKAAPKEMDNRFIAVLLVAEGFKAAYMLPSIFPESSDWWWLYEYTVQFRGTLFQTAHIIAILMYFCFPIYFRVNRLSFLYKPSLQRHAWYLPTLLTVMYMVVQVYQQNPLHVVQNLAYIQCDTIGSAPTALVVIGTETALMTDMLQSIGTCEAELWFLLGDGGEFGWAAIALSFLVSIFALFIMRASMKQYASGSNQNASESLTSRSLYIGFLGKVLGTTLFLLMIFVITPMLNPISGVNIFVDQALALLQGPTLQGKLFLYSMMLNGYLVSLPIAFEALMFVHASMKDTVLGIDERLRKTFATAILTGLGAVLFLVGSEAVEGLLPLPGMLGGVLLGATILLIRKPIIGIIDGVSTNILPSAYSDSEIAYLEAYTTAMEDNIVTDQERSMLVTLASSLKIGDDRALEIEMSFNSGQILDEKIADN
ncbi:MAG: hypothetical protein CMB72_02970 [Euryarchaeota archaeon]|nr:hypothetical protein [Euryarchaeota archaeon]